MPEKGRMGASARRRANTTSKARARVTDWDDSINALRCPNLRRMFELLATQDVLGVRHGVAALLSLIARTKQAGASAELRRPDLRLA